MLLAHSNLITEESNQHHFHLIYFSFVVGKNIFVEVTVAYFPCHKYRLKFNHQLWYLFRKNLLVFAH
jgi:hypothetical protein